MKRYWVFFAGSVVLLEPEVPLPLADPLADPVADLSVLDGLLLGEVVEDEPPDADPELLGLDGGVVALEDDEPEPDGLVELPLLMPEDELEPG